MWINIFILIALIETLFVSSHRRCQSRRRRSLHKQDLSCVFQGQKGFCLPLPECESIWTKLEDEYIYDDLIRCGFDGTDIMICCPGDNKNPIKRPKMIPLTKGVRAHSSCESYRKGRPAYTMDNIFGGHITKRGAFPHMAAFGYKDGLKTKWGCGGSLISKRYVITAAHCVNKNLFTIRIGRNKLHDTNETAQDFKIEDIKLYKEYKPGKIYHDIALIRLNKDVKLDTFACPACLFNKFEGNSGQVLQFEKLIASGWGITHPDKHEKPDYFLRHVELTVTNYTYCKEQHEKADNDPRFPKGILQSQICTFEGNNNDTCKGDSGGPLQMVEKDIAFSSIVAIVSSGYSCGSNLPSIYTKVEDYLDWIEDIVWPMKNLV